MGGKRILMGVVGRPHGVRGLVHVHSHAEQDLAGYSPLLDEAGREWTLAWRGEGIAELRDSEGIALPDRTAAEQLVNGRLYVERERLPDPDPEEFYLSDLLGVRAVDADGTELGRVAQVHDYGAGASLELDSGALIPFSRACVPEVDLAAGMLTVIPPQNVELSREPSPGEEERGEAGGRTEGPLRTEQAASIPAHSRRPVREREGAP